jgi:hypothetical protein
VKNLRNGIFCACLLSLAGIVPVPAGARQQSSDPPPANPTVAQKTGVEQNSLPSEQQQDPAQQAPPQQTPPVQTAPPQNPPQTAAPPQTPVQQNPPQQTPPDNALQPQQRGRIPEPPAPPPKVPDVKRPGESGYFLGVLAWFPKQQPVFDRGHGNTYTGSSLIKLQGSPKYADGAEVGLGVGQHNSIRFSFFDVHANGDTTVAKDLVVWAQGYTAGTYVSTNYDIRNFKASYEFLTWPYPVGSRRFRLKTLWQLQYTSMKTTFDAPLNYYDTSGNLLIDPSTGNPINLVASGTRKIISPTFGLGAHYFETRHFRIEANASGFVIPHHYTIWDADATINLRLIGHVELRLGAKAFHLKTSTQADYFNHGTLTSAMIGLRWYQLSE